MFLPLFPLLLPPLLTSALANRLRIMQNKRVFFVTEREARRACLPRDPVCGLTVAVGLAPVVGVLACCVCRLHARCCVLYVACCYVAWCVLHVASCRL